METPLSNSDSLHEVSKDIKIPTTMPVSIPKRVVKQRNSSRKSFLSLLSLAIYALTIFVLSSIYFKNKLNNLNSSSIDGLISPTVTVTPSTESISESTGCEIPTLNGTDSIPWSGGGISLSWTTVEGAKSYTLQRSQDGPDHWVDVTTRTGNTWNGRENSDRSYRVRTESCTYFEEPGSWSPSFNPAS